MNPLVYGTMYPEILLGNYIFSFADFEHTGTINSAIYHSILSALF